MRCRLCDSIFYPYVSWSDLLSFDPIFEPILCVNCMKKFKKIEKNTVCPICCGKKPCDECHRWLEEGEFHHNAYYEYNEWAKQWLNRYKILGDYQLKDSFNQVLYHQLNYYRKQNYLFVPIPISNHKYNERGFNQVVALLDSCHMPYEALIRKKLDLPAQGLKSRIERLATPQPFELLTNQSYQRLLIIDDIYTTGRTIAHAYQCLRPIAKKIESFSLFRSVII